MGAARCSVVRVSCSVVVSTVEGTRPIMAELQALVTPTSFGNPRRTAIGIDYGRFTLLLAVLEKRVGLHLMGQDVYVNVVGGLRVEEPSVDLGVIAAVASALFQYPMVWLAVRIVNRRGSDPRDGEAALPQVSRRWDSRSRTAGAGTRSGKYPSKE